jgi:hypothetical protein
MISRTARNIFKNLRQSGPTIAPFQYRCTEIPLLLRVLLKRTLCVPEFGAPPASLPLRMPRGPRASSETRLLSLWRHRFPQQHSGTPPLSPRLGTELNNRNMRVVLKLLNQRRHHSERFLKYIKWSPLRA